MNPKTMNPKTKNILSWIVAGILALLFLMAGITKLLGLEMALKHLENWGYPAWFRFPIGLTEVIIGVALLWPKYRRILVYAIYVWTVVAIYTHVQANEAIMAIVPAFFALLATALLFLAPKKSNS